ncbi:MAG: hypothetical protein LCH73_11805 [Proteobacteria bacterium]|nr:hypothetical protein [Pseudomonadota bacterium]
MSTAHITFTKGAGKFDQMTVHRADGDEVVACPKQRIIPHDMAHYAVEHTLGRRGFLSRVREGEVAAFRMQPDAESDAVERLVEVFQGDAWSGGTSAPQDLLDLYHVTCAARACQPLAVTLADLAAVRAAFQALDAQWQALPVGLPLAL